MENVISKYFYKNQKELNYGPKWNMSLKACGSMRFRWNETNPNRIEFLNKISGDKQIAQIELIHSKDVFAVNSSDELNQVKGDGIITKNKKLIPTVTVADCVPIFIWDEKNDVFGMLHSGWKGTGIVKNAIEKACEVYGSKAEDFLVVIGPHIQSCCYEIDKNRAEYFIENFGENSVSKISEDLYSLSLTQANINCLEKAGVKKENIFASDECTCCNEKFGSFRRETSVLDKNIPNDVRMKSFTVQAAWIDFE